MSLSVSSLSSNEPDPRLDIQEEEDLYWDDLNNGDGGVMDSSYEYSSSTPQQPRAARRRRRQRQAQRRRGRKAPPKKEKKSNKQNPRKKVQAAVVRECMDICVLAKEGKLSELEETVRNANPESLDSFYKNRTPLMWAAASNQADAVEFLLAHGASPNVVSKQKSVLHYAARHASDPRIVQMLLEAGSDATLSDYSDWEPIHYAAQGGHLENVRLLLEYGADINAVVSESGKTPLHACVNRFNLPTEMGCDMVEFLIKNGADPHIVIRKNGERVLHMAVLRGSIVLLEKLLSLGVNPFLRNRDGLTALEVAEANTREEHAAVLTKYIHAKPTLPPGMPIEITVEERGPDFITLSWSYAIGGVFIGVRIFRCEDDGVYDICERCDPTETKFTIRKLKEGTWYGFKICVSNAVGDTEAPPVWACTVLRHSFYKLTFTDSRHCVACSTDVKGMLWAVGYACSRCGMLVHPECVRTANRTAQLACMRPPIPEIAGVEPDANMAMFSQPSSPEAVPELAWTGDDSDFGNLSESSYEYSS